MLTDPRDAMHVKNESNTCVQTNSQFLTNKTSTENKVHVVVNKRIPTHSTFPANKTSVLSKKTAFKFICNFSIGNKYNRVNQNRKNKPHLNILLQKIVPAIIYKVKI